MHGYSGSLVLLQIANPLKIAEFTTIGGMRTTKFVLNNQIVDISTKDSGRWRQLLGGVGVVSVVVAGSGIFTDQNSERIMRKVAFEGSAASFKLIFGNGDALKGRFVISTYERSGIIGEEETYNINLESAGNILYQEGTKHPVCANEVL